MSQYYFSMTGETKTRALNHLRKIAGLSDYDLSVDEGRGQVEHPKLGRVVEIKEQTSYDKPWSKSGNDRLFVNVGLPYYDKKKFIEKKKDQSFDYVTICTHLDKEIEKHLGIVEYQESKQTAIDKAAEILKEQGLVDKERWYFEEGQRYGIKYAASYGRDDDHNIVPGVELTLTVKPEQVLDLIEQLKDLTLG